MGLEWAKYGKKTEIWLTQGCMNTIRSYDKVKGMPQEHIDFFQNAHLYHIENNKLFVHAGLDVNQKDMTKQDPQILMWDRQLIKTARIKGFTNPDKKLTTFDEVFIGHTTTLLFKTTNPVKACEIWDLDTGGGWSGKLTIMDLETKEYWQSDFCYNLYPESNGRDDYR